MKNFRRTFFCKLHLKLCYFYLMDTTSLYCFSSKPFQLKSLETKNVRSLFDFVAFMKTIQFPSNLKLKITLFVKPF
ncbi:hypothetical protein MHU86_9582 (mitochondrion) [Fragilaria crotonensis]|nr:hypothetical protein MHU86_9580 [Fragilaria crotonensis]KAI2504813.1 hypothetical protein MHU86_9582 [Fragilaria crotonensis]